MARGPLGFFGEREKATDDPSDYELRRRQDVTRDVLAHIRAGREHIRLAGVARNDYRIAEALDRLDELEGEFIQDMVKRRAVMDMRGLR